MLCVCLGAVGGCGGEPDATDSEATSKDAGGIAFDASADVEDASTEAHEAAAADVVVPDATEDAFLDSAPDAPLDAPPDAPSEAGLTCTMCHGDPVTGESAPPVDTHGGSATSMRGVGAHAAHRAKGVDQLVPHGPIACQSCHKVPGDVAEASHIDSTPGAEVVFSGLALTTGASPSGWQSGQSTSCQGTYCHGGTLSGGSLTAPAWTVADGTQAACGTCHGAPPSPPHPASTACQHCHGSVIADCPTADPSECQFQPDNAPDETYKMHVDGIVQVSVDGCTGCHGAPPDNGMHAVHAGGADPPDKYGDLDPRTNNTAYGLNCGYCHPLDAGKHMNGSVDVELYNAQAPAPPLDPHADGDRRAIKRASPGATYVPGTTTLPGEVRPYTNGTCSQVYCHSEQVEYAPSVPPPDVGVSQPSFVWQSVDPFMNESANSCCNGTADDYPDFSIAVVREFRSPAWESTPTAGPARCAGCHGYPPRNTDPAGSSAGDSHAWIVPASEGGYEGGHFYNMGAGEPLQCRRCHSKTVAADLDASQWHYVAPSGMISFDAAMPIGDYDMHINGKKDVAFGYSPAGCDAGNPDLPYNNTPCLTDALYDPSTRSCSTVECHLAQSQVTWGAPYREWIIAECNACHQY